MTSLAKALYDNIAESPDELAFQKGDTLVILEQNTNNLEGWWLCSLRGRQGLCPGNRLRIIPTVFNDPRGETGVLPIPNDLSLLQQQGKRRSWHVQPNKVVTPKKFKDVYLYDNPQTLMQTNEGEFYDIPRTIPCPSPNNKMADFQENYDVPRPLVQLTPSSSASSLTNESLNSSNRSSFVNIPDYDIPKPHTRPIAQQQQQQQHQQNQHILHNTAQQIYDIPSSQRLKELPLEIDCALETLEKLHSEAMSSIKKILQLLSTSMKNQDVKSNLMEIKLGVIRLKTALHDFTEFSERVLGNAANVSDKTLVNKLLPLVQSLQNSDSLVSKVCDKLQQDQDWYKCVEEDKIYKLDEFEELICCSRSLTEEIRQISSFVQGNAPLLFKKNVNDSNSHNQHHIEDYDYVNLESKEMLAKRHAEISNDLPPELRKKYNSLVESSDKAAFGDDKLLDPNEKDILTFYANQAITHHKNLTQAIDAFLQTVEHNQPPKIFLAHGKFVVLSAHKLVSIGDAVHRSVTKSDLKIQALTSANALSAALATTVAKTKQAALQFPSVTAVQEMVDSVVDISHYARDIKLTLIQATQPIY